MYNKYICKGILNLSYLAFSHAAIVGVINVYNTVIKLSTLLAKQSKAKQSKAKQSKAKQSKAKQSKAKQSKAKHEGGHS